MASHYHPVTPEVIAKLKVIVGDENVRCDEETLIQYQTDEEGNPYRKGQDRRPFEGGRTCKAGG